MDALSLGSHFPHALHYICLVTQLCDCIQLNSYSVLLRHFKMGTQVTLQGKTQREGEPDLYWDKDLSAWAKQNPERFHGPEAFNGAAHLFCWRRKPCRAREAACSRVCSRAELACEQRGSAATKCALRPGSASLLPGWHVNMNHCSASSAFLCTRTGENHGGLHRVLQLEQSENQDCRALYHMDTKLTCWHQSYCCAWRNYHNFLNWL